MRRQSACSALFAACLLSFTAPSLGQDAPSADPNAVAAADPSPGPAAAGNISDPEPDGAGTDSKPSNDLPASAPSAPAANDEAPAGKASGETKPEIATPAAAEAPPSLAGPVFALEGLRDLLPKAREGADVSAETKAVSAIYAARRDDAIWVTPKGLNARGANAIAEIKKADDWGLEAKDYVLPSLPDAASNTTALPLNELAEAEMKISFAVLAYARDARGGRITLPSKQLSSYLDREPQIIEPRIFLEEVAGSDDPGEMLRKLHPQHAQFEKLRQKYLALRSQAATAKSVVLLPSTGPKLVPGITHPHVALLRQRLGVVASGAGGGAADESFYDITLEAAVKAYQGSHGQKPDGVVGKTTRTSLNDVDVPDPQRLLANMEQWRWMPADLGETYINVNIPEFMVRIVQNGKVTFEERVVTGQTDKQTPVFSDELETLYFHPRWNVPESIKVLELYPGLARGGGSFERQGLKLMRNGREVSPASVDWSQADIRNFDVYQPSGDGNVLGLVKFAFPNKHGVYMHDTSSKGLFEEASRPFSHGCMRVRNPLKYAAAVLAIDKGWPESKVQDILDSSPDEVAVQIDKKIPVHVTYFTDVIGDDGEEKIFKDVYGHENRIKLALAGKWDQIAVGADHLAPVKFERAQYALSPDDFGAFFGFGPSPTGYSSNSGSYKPATSLGDFFNDVFGGPAPAQKKPKRKASQ